MADSAELRVKKLRIAVAADDAELGVRVLREAEALVPEVLEELSATLGDELWIVRRLELRLLLRSLAAGALPGPELGRALRAALSKRLAAAKTDPSAGAWYPSRASALAAYLVAFAQGSATRWPFVALRSWGASAADALEFGIAQGAFFLADTLAELARGAALPATIPPALAPRLLQVFESGAGAWLDAAELPEQTLRALAQLWTNLPAQDSNEQKQLSAIAQLFASWPPARALRISGANVEATLRAVASPDPGPGVEDDGRDAASAEKTAPARASAAGALLFWAYVFSRWQLDIAALYPAARVASAVRHAIGRALELPTLPSHDALLLLWAGEHSDAHVHFDGVLSSADAEPLHALAVALAARLGYLDGGLRIVPLGDEQVALGGGLVVDSSVAADGDTALPELVRNFRRRAPGLEVSVEIVTTLDTESLDTIREVDTPFAPPPFQRALRALGSVLRRLLRERFRAELSAARGWPAILRRDAIEVRRRDAASLDAGRWANEGVELGGTRYRITLI